jgi:hypothetical protein
VTVLVLLALMLSVERSAAQCVGDCDNSGMVGVNELVLGTNIALGQTAVTRCTALDRDSSGGVTVNELVEAVNAALRGCFATPVATVTRTASVPLLPTPTSTSTAMPNPTPQAQCRTVYRTFAEQPISLLLPATDPGDNLLFTADPLPGGAQLNAASGQFSWTPSTEQLGPFYLPFSATDSASQTAQGEVFFKVSPLDACTTATCDPATGCTADIVPLAQDCCDDGPLPDRVAEPVIPCPEGRVVFVGANVVSGFGRLRNCDRLRFDVSGGQSAPALRFRVAARCLNTDFPITIQAQLSTRTRANVFNRTTTIILTPRNDGFAYGVAIFALLVTGFDLEDAEGTLRIRLTDVDQATTSNAFRFILTSALLNDLPDVDQTAPTPPPAPCDNEKSLDGISRRP